MSGHPSAADGAWDRESSPVKDERSTTVQRSQMLTMLCTSGFVLCRYVMISHNGSNRPE